MPLLARPSQQPLLAAQRPFAQERQAERRQASGAGKGLGKGPSVVDAASISPAAEWSPRRMVAWLMPSTVS